MRNLAEKWAVVPDWNAAVIETPTLAIRALSGLNQYYVSGNLATWHKASGIASAPVGAFGAASGSSYCVQVARDRLLVVADTPSALPDGWNDAGFAITDISAGLHVFEVGGAWREIAARATTLDPDKAGPSAAMAFAGGLDAIVYRHDDKLRVHVDRGLAAYFWSWATVVCANIDRA